jgi:hypothetical protein
MKTTKVPDGSTLSTVVGKIQTLTTTVSRIVLPLGVGIDPDDRLVAQGMRNKRVHPPE